MGWTDFTRHAGWSEGRRIPTRPQSSHRPNDATGALSSIVASPVWVGFLYGVESSVAVPLYIRLGPQERPLLKVGFFAVMMLVLMLLALMDRRTLRARGFDATPGSLWMLATPIAYLARRARLVDGADRGPLVIYLGLLCFSFLAVLLGIALGIQQLAA